ncbi:hypothetical protein PENANT_c009G07720 [Penicillium antarcticum]|uniref:Uncharacterized protein n=1 Tax=Penicillium antarcticum TaxID=416450 RepID=A0A1V6Q9B5_9EURO|nr:hypothetical protein PENANT_c009G07720 [Penicillium antarcticum]
MGEMTLDLSNEELDMSDMTSSTRRSELQFSWAGNGTAYVCSTPYEKLVQSEVPFSALPVLVFWFTAVVEIGIAYAHAHARGRPIFEVNAPRTALSRPWTQDVDTSEEGLISGRSVGLNPLGGWELGSMFNQAIASLTLTLTLSIFSKVDRVTPGRTLIAFEPMPRKQQSAAAAGTYSTCTTHRGRARRLRDVATQKTFARMTVTSPSTALTPTWQLLFAPPIWGSGNEKNRGGGSESREVEATSFSQFLFTLARFWVNAKGLRAKGVIYYRLVS